MRILTGIDLYFLPKYGGSLILSNDLYTALQKEHEVLFLSLQPPSSDHWSSIRNVRYLDLKKTNYAAAFPAYVAAMEDRLREVIASFRPDIIHMHHLNFGLSLALSRVAPHIPQLGFCHGTDVLYAGNSPFFMDVFREIERSLQHIIFPSRSIMKDFSAISHNAGITRHFVPWGVMFDSTQPPRERGQETPFKVLFAGRSSPEKGLHILQEAMRCLDRSFEILIISDLEADALPRADHTVGAQVYYAPTVPRRELWQVFSSFDLLVIPSTLEAFCLTAIEAQGAGLPVLYSDIDCLKEVVGQSGMHFISGDAADLAKKIIFLRDHPEQLNELSVLGRRNADAFSMVRFCDTVLKISNEVIHAG